ncbi:MAG: Uma2 family endonuclease, partial [Candidatus Schekmanbacteria bacterium]|nr:Uma2 family endonuclease [Candidatus Schekmanbacteria bacterium]
MPCSKGSWSNLSTDYFPDEGMPWPASLPPTVRSLEWLGLDPDLDWELINRRLYLKFPEGVRHGRAKGATSTHVEDAISTLPAAAGMARVVREEIRILSSEGMDQPDSSVFIGAVPDDDHAETPLAPVLVIEVERLAQGNRKRPKDKRA